MNVSDPDTTTRSNPQGASTTSTTGATQAGPFGGQGQKSPNPGSSTGDRGQSGRSQTGSGQTGSSQTGSGQSGSSQFGSSQSGSGQSGSSQSGSSQASSSQARQAGDSKESDRQQGSGLPNADRLLDELMPEQVEWETLVRRYPKPALLAAAGLGFYIALQRGPTLVAAFSGFAAQEMTRRVNDFLGSDVI